MALTTETNMRDFEARKAPSEKMTASPYLRNFLCLIVLIYLTGCRLVRLTVGVLFTLPIFNPLFPSGALK